MRAGCSTRQGEFRGWEAYYLENEYVRLAAVPDVGGRIMAYDLGPYPYLFVNETLAGKLFSPEENQGDGSLAAWKNVGGDKTWPAPQGWERDDQWHGPPDPVLDSGRYQLDTLGVVDGCAVISMTSPPDPRTSLQITRRATLLPGGSRVRLDLTFHNVSLDTVRWSLWDVAQLRAERLAEGGGLAYEPGCVVTAPLNPASRFPEGFQVMFGEVDNPQWQADRARGLFVAPYQFQIGKVGLDVAAGWIAFANTAEGFAFAERFAHQLQGEYPDGGATVEVWTTGAGRVGNMTFEESPLYHMETEVLSPLYTLPPGESASFAIEWGACRCAGAVIAVSEAGCLSAPLAVTREGERARITAAGGVFDDGALELVWRDGAGAALASVALGRADPLTHVALDRVEPVPSGARSVALRLTPEGGAPRTLAEATV